MKISIKSNIGKRRASNQDYADYFVNDYQQVLLILCDGVGGNQAGDVASRMTTEFIGEQFIACQSLFLEEVEDWLGKAITQANLHIYQASMESAKLEGMSTTLVLVLIIEDRLFIAHVGDSRAYIYRRDELKQMTEDHSLVNELIRSGEITAEEGQYHPIRNVVTQSIGGTDTVAYEISQLAIDQVETLLICSDGLTNMVSFEQLKDNFDRPQASLDQLAQDLIDQANQAGGLDNITVILVRDLEQKRLEEVPNHD